MPMLSARQVIIKIVLVAENACLSEFSDRLRSTHHAVRGMTISMMTLKESELTNRANSAPIHDPINAVIIAGMA